MNDTNKNNVKIDFWFKFIENDNFNSINSVNNYNNNVPIIIETTMIIIEKIKNANLMNILSKYDFQSKWKW